MPELVKYNTAEMNPADLSYHDFSNVLCGKQLDERQLAEILAWSADTDSPSLLKLLQLMAHAQPVERFRGLRRLLQPADRSLRNRLLTLAMSCDVADWKNDVIEHILEVEAVGVRRVLVSRDLESFADEAVTFAITQLLQQDGIEHLRAWLLRVAMRQAILLKKRAAKTSADVPEGHDEAASLLEFSQQQNLAEVSHACDAVRECRKQVLSAEEDRILDFHFFQERSGREIAELLSMPMSTVYKRRENAIAKLKRCLTHKQGDHDA